MTAEMAIMNREAIALASDSAVTSTMGSMGSGPKIFTSANKLFSLSQYHPVGVMIYGNASLMNAPWELIIKTYRKHLGKKEFATIEEYTADLVVFLNSGNPLFPESVQDKYFKATINAYFTVIRDEIKQKIKSVVDDRGSISEKEIGQAVSQFIEAQVIQFRKAERVPSIPANHSKIVIDKYGKFIDGELVNVLEKLPISKTNTNRLRKIAADLASKFPSAMKFEGTTGVVVAGFGKDDYYPVLRSIIIEMVVCNKLKYKIDKTKKITIENGASIIPFAQGEVVATFMEGIDPFLHRTEASYLAEVFKKCAERITNEATGLDDSQKADINTRLLAIGEEELVSYRKKLATFRKLNYIGPVMSVVSMLPKDELAAMAEAFVNLTSFKRKVSVGPETVGGPIDVAVISKGDGFIWIKRKHYFEPSLNPQFFSKYSREVENG